MLNKKYVPLLLGGGGLKPALNSSIRQKLFLTSQAASPQPWLTVVDSLDILTVPTIEAGDIRQSDFGIVDNVTVDVDGVPFVAPRVSDFGGHPRYINSTVPIDVFYDAEWKLVVNGTFHLHPTASGTFPDKTGWPDEAGESVSVAYNSYWVASEEVVDKTFANLLVHYYNTNGSNGLWVKKLSDTEWKADQYVLNTEFTEQNYNKNVRFYGKGGGALREQNGDLILDVGGFVIFNQFEDQYEVGGVPISGVIAPSEVIP